MSRHARVPAPGHWCAGGLRHVWLVVAGCVVLAGCAQTAATPVPSVTAAGVDPAADAATTTDPAAAPPRAGVDEATPRGDGSDAPTSDPTPEPSPTVSTADPTPSPTAVEEPGDEPAPTDIARLVGDEVAAAGDGAQHVVADLDDDGTPEVVVAGVVEDRARVRVWWWGAGVGFEELDRLDAGPGRAVVEVRVADVTSDGTDELLVRIGGGARDSLALWSVEGPGEVRPLEAVGGCFAGSHVFGATSARLQSRGEDPPAILATCDDTPLPVADWSTAVYEFRDGAYRFVPSPIGPVDEEEPVADGPVEDVTTGPVTERGGGDPATGGPPDG